MKHLKNKMQFDIEDHIPEIGQDFPKNTLWAEPALIREIEKICEESKIGQSSNSISLVKTPYLPFTRDNGVVIRGIMKDAFGKISLIT